MADISLDLNQGSGTYKDFLIVDGDLVMTSDSDSNGTNPILQDVLQRISLFQGEWFMDNTAGVPYYQQVLIKNPDLSKIDAIILNTILDTLGILQVNSYSFTPNFAARTLKIAFKAQSTSGPIDYSGTITTGGVVTV